MRWPLNVLGTLLFAMALAGCDDDPVPVPGATDGGLVWTSCPPVECATLAVPLDHDAPEGPVLEIALARRPADSQQDRIGSLVVNPGGPGGSGVLLATFAGFFFPEELLERFDIVGFDPRGAASSRPAVNCTDDLTSFLAIDLSPDDEAERQAVVSENEKLALGCQAKSADILPYLGTPQVVRDMDLIRAAIGDEQLTYLGFSYGTFLGAHYADRYPDRVRALVLDGAVDPARDGEALVRGQALGFEQQLEAFLADCAADPRCAFHGAEDPTAAYDALVAAIDAEPLSVDGRTLGPGEVWWAVVDSLYGPGAWKDLAEALAAAEAGDGAPLMTLFDGAVGRDEDGAYDDFLEQYLAISSIDTVYPSSFEAFEAIAREMATEAPRMGVGLVYNSVLPVYWPVPPVRTPAPVSAVGAPPILVIGTVGDPATPYVWAESLADELDSGLLLTYEGNGHTVFAKGVDCIDDATVRYLVSLEVPAEGTRCAASEE